MELISYALDFSSFFIQNTKFLDRISSIILFGSVARGEANKESDVDIFIDVIGEEKKIDSEIKRIVLSFFSSVKFKNYWKLLNIKNEINVVVGKLEEWKLKDSMLGSSVILYGYYKPKLEKGRNITLLSWKGIKENSKRVMLNKKLFGYNYYGKFYKGILLENWGRKIGNNVIAIPTEKINLFIKELRKFKVSLKISRMFEYEE